MRRVSRSGSAPLVLLAAALAGGGALAVACADTAAEAGPPADPAADGGRTRRDASGADVDAAADAGPRSTCAITRAFFEACGLEGDLNCGAAKFDAWCADNDRVINSEAFRRAEAACLVEANCRGEDRRDCEYRHYHAETATASQVALVAAYCETCEPADESGCAARATRYEPAKGIESVGDVFIAAWELADPIVDEIAARCTGARLDAGAGADASANAGAACAKAFAGCAADVYLAHLPDCPE